MTQWLRQSTAATVIMGPFLDQTNGYTPETGLTAGGVDEIGVYKHDGTTLTDISGTTTFTSRAGGMYTMTLSTSDTGTLGRLTAYVRDDDVCLPVWKEFLVVPANEFDSLILGTDALDVEVASMAANALTATAIDADAITNAKIADDAIGAENLATDAISADAMSTGAADEIATEVWNESTRALTDKAGFSISGTKQTLDALNDIAAGAAMDLVADAVDASALAADAVTEIVAGMEDLSSSDVAAAVWDQDATTYQNAGTFGKTLGDEAGAGTSLYANVNTVDTVVDGIQTDLDNATDGLGALKTLIDAIQTDLDNGTDGLGALKALIDAVDTVVDAIQTDLDNGTDGLGAIKTAVDACATPAEVNAQVLDVLVTDTFTEPGQEAPGYDISLKDKIGYLYKFLRNKIVTDATSIEVYNQDESTIGQKSTISDDGTDFTRGEFGSGP